GARRRAARHRPPHPLPHPRARVRHRRITSTPRFRPCAHLLSFCRILRSSLRSHTALGWSSWFWAPHLVRLPTQAALRARFLYELFRVGDETLLDQVVELHLQVVPGLRAAMPASVPVELTFRRSEPVQKRIDFCLS